MNNLSLSIIIPCYNEKNTIEIIVKKIRKNNELKKEIIIVDDYSNDGTKEIIHSLQGDDLIKLFHDKNYGKGRAIKTALEFCKNDIILIQDADLEYDPNEYSNLLRPFIEADADVVFGSRFLGGQKYSRIHYFWHYIANKLLTFTTNIFTNLNMSDMETCYKLFKRSVIKNINIEEKSFGIEPERCC